MHKDCGRKDIPVLEAGVRGWCYWPGMGQPCSARMMRQKMDLTTGQKVQCNKVEETEDKNSTQRVSTGYFIIILA